MNKLTHSQSDYNESMKKEEDSFEYPVFMQKR